MRKVFISYARQNKPDIEQLVEHLRVLGCNTRYGSSLHGGQDWWDEGRKIDPYKCPMSTCLNALRPTSVPKN